ncbi:MAG: YhcH/YjgK/YiaL family protein [Clostridia bacterium]|nr:YhcH/YjgK/YiaL family protein [Clostridia bacterium]
MIIDNLGKIEKYKGLSKLMDKALDYISMGLNPDMENGKSELDGREIYSVCAEYETKTLTEGKNEAHRKYIDIQILLKGRELIYSSHVEDLSVITAYDEEKDVLFLEKSTETAIEMKEGMFCVFFPWDAHMPGISIGDKPEKIKKVVFKIHV